MLDGASIVSGGLFEMHGLGDFRAVCFILGYHSVSRHQQITRSYGTLCAK